MQCSIKKISIFICFVLVSGTIAAKTRTVVDMRDKKITIPEKVNRVIGTGGAVDEWVLLLGSPQKLVATSTSIRSNPWYVKVYPQIVNVPVSINSNDTNVETLLALQPDAALELSGVALITTAEQAGIPTFVLERDNPEQLMQGIMIAGKVLGSKEEKRAEEFCAYYRANIKKITDKTSTLSQNQRLRVYYASGKTTSEGTGSIVTSWIDMGGGFNTTTQTGMTNSTSQTIAIEDVVRWDPEVIVTMSPTIAEYITSDQQWKNITAVKNKHVYTIPKGIYQWGVRAAEEALQVLWIGKLLHPELFPELDMVKETIYFHKKFYNYEMSNEEAQRMLDGLPPL